MSKKIEAPVVAEKIVQKTAADKLWDEIKDLDVQMFALPPQKLASYAKRIDLDPGIVHVQLSIEAALPIIETTLGVKYAVTRHDKFVTISRVES